MAVCRNVAIFVLITDIATLLIMPPIPSQQSSAPQRGSARRIVAYLISITLYALVGMLIYALVAWLFDQGSNGLEGLWATLTSRDTLSAGVSFFVARSVLELWRLYQRRSRR